VASLTYGILPVVFDPSGYLACSVTVVWNWRRKTKEARWWHRV